MASTASSSNASPATGSPLQAKKKLAIPEVKKPNLDEYNAKIEAAQQVLDGLYKQMNELNDEMSQLSQGAADFTQKREAYRLSVDKLQSEMDELETERNRLMSQMEETARAGRDMKTKVQDLKRNLGFETDDEIDGKIRELERVIMSQRMSVAEENKYIQRIRQLEKSKPLIVKYAHMEADANSHSQTAILPLRIRLDEIRDILRDKQQKKRQLGDQFGQVLAARNKANAPIRDLADKKDSIRRQIVDKRREVNEYRDEMHKKQREYEAYLAKVVRAQGELRAEERRQRALEQQKQNLLDRLQDIDDEGSWSSEYQLTHQTVLYLKKLVDRLQTTEAPDQKTDEQQTESNALLDEGLVPIKPKHSREEEYYFAPTKKREKNNKKKKQQIISSHQTIVHDLSSLADFQRLGVTAPLTLKECPPVLKVLEERLGKLKAAHLESSATMKKRKEEILAMLQALEKTSIEKPDSPMVDPTRPEGVSVA